MRVPIEYMGDVGEASFLPVDPEKMSPMQRLASEALGGSRSYQNLSETEQTDALQALSLLGVHTITRVNGRWSSARWAETYETLTEEFPRLVSIGENSAGRDYVPPKAYKRLFHMLETGAKSARELEEIKRVSHGRDYGGRFGTPIASRTIGGAAARAYYYASAQKRH